MSASTVKKMRPDPNNPNRVLMKDTNGQTNPMQSLKGLMHTGILKNRNDESLSKDQRIYTINPAAIV